MICLIPLAGPDFERPDGSVKAQAPVDGQPLLRRALESRSWWRSGELNDDGLVFVLRDTDRSRAFARDDLGAWYPQSRAIFLSDYTGGAALTALAGAAMTAQRDGPVCVDLVDILFQDEVRPTTLFTSHVRAGGLGLWFEANNPLYSYFERGADGLVTRVAEKTVISREASAGVYLFRSPSVYLRAVAHSLDHRDTLAHRGLLYVAPCLNGVIADGWEVHAAQVSQVHDVKIAAQGDPAP